MDVLDYLEEKGYENALYNIENLRKVNSEKRIDNTGCYYTTERIYGELEEGESFPAAIGQAVIFIERSPIGYITPNSN